MRRPFYVVAAQSWCWEELHVSSQHSKDIWSGGTGIWIPQTAVHKYFYCGRSVYVADYLIVRRCQRILKTFWSVSEASGAWFWGVLGCLGSVVGMFSHIIQVSWSIFSVFWRSRGVLDAVWRAPGSLVDAFWARSGASTVSFSWSESRYYSQWLFWYIFINVWDCFEFVLERNMTHIQVTICVWTSLKWSREKSLGTL